MLEATRAEPLSLMQSAFSADDGIDAAGLSALIGPAAKPAGTEPGGSADAGGKPCAGTGGDADICLLYCSFKNASPLEGEVGP